MIALALLIAYVIIIGSIGARGLQSARWPQRSPWLGMLAWQALSASVLLAALLTGVTLAVPTLSISTRLASLLDACWEAIREQYTTPGGATAASVGVLLVIAILGRLGFTLALEVLTTHCRRRTQRRGLMMVASRDATMGVFVVPHASSAVYCLPGRPGVVVCTSAAAAALDGPEMAAVLAHERAHLRSRHDMVLTAAAGLRAAFPFVPAFTLARAELGRLVEMQADDAAAAAGERRVLASALVRLAAGAVPAVEMGGWWYDRLGPGPATRAPGESANPAGVGARRCDGADGCAAAVAHRGGACASGGGAGLLPAGASAAGALRLPVSG